MYQGVFAATLPVSQVPDYRIAVTYPAPDAAGATLPETVADDPYRHLPTLGEIDLHLIAEGRHEELWKVLGAHVSNRAGGTAFAVWAPNARGIRVIGDFNHWDGRAHPMRSLGGSGVWELFVPGIGPGTRYKYDICGPDGNWRQKADPMASLAERPPATASVVCESRYEWADQEWMAARARHDPLGQPMSMYEVHLGSWRPGLSYAELADQLTAYVTGLGFTHVEFLPVAEHPFGGSWGYQVTSYYAPSARFGAPDDFRYLVDRLHQAGIGVVIDWVPAHFPRDDWAMARFDGTPLYEHPDPQRGEHPDWGTLIFDFGRPRSATSWSPTRSTGWRNSTSTACGWTPWRRCCTWTTRAGTASGHRMSRRPGESGGRLVPAGSRTPPATSGSPGIMMIAEESTAWPGVTKPAHEGGLGFGLKWNLGWMHDTLSYLSVDPVFRHFHHERDHVLDDVRVQRELRAAALPRRGGARQGIAAAQDARRHWKQFAGLRSLLAYQWAHPGKQLLFMGSEFGQDAEWSEQAGLAWPPLGDTRAPRRRATWSPT